MAGARRRTSTVWEFERFCKTHPRPHQAPTWNQRCEQLVNNAGSFGADGAFPTAHDAAQSSGQLDAHHHTAKVGEFHYWSTNGSAPGHVALQTRTGLLMASSLIEGFLGYLSFEEFAKGRPDFNYLGHSPRHGQKKLSSFGRNGMVRRPSTEVDNLMRFKTKHFYVTDLFTMVEVITQEEARALDDASGGINFEPVTSDHARLIIAGVKRRRLAALEEQARAIGGATSDQVIAAVSKQFDDLAANESDFTADDVARDLAESDAQD
jgi:hypothetical protein